MHVLIVPSWYPTERNPIAGIFFKDQAKALQEKGYKVTIAYPEIIPLREKSSEKMGYSVKEEDGIITYRYSVRNPFPRRFKTFERLLYSSKLKILYKEIIKEQGIPDVIHAHSSFLAGWSSNKLSAIHKVPIVLTEHSSTIGKGKLTPKQKRLLSEILSEADKVISVGPGLAKTLGEYIPEDKLKMIPNLVNTDEFGIETHIGSEKFRFFSLARLDSNKGMDVLVDAYTNAFSSEDNTELVIGGDGPLKEELKNQVAKKGLQGNVHFLGQLNRDQVINEMQKCDAFVLASKYETFGIVYLEALASGKPIIATKCGGPEIIVNNKNGILVPVDNQNELADALKSILKTAEEYSPEEIRQDCIARFGKERIIQDISRLYEEAIRNK
ncbi:glycosyltransferase [Virgibacillus kekensis]|uniref:Glycosyltransferase n=1 Tax=Virgibacillus kekensis TaxID=202261 RepID=A0ABV9DJ38_9BACI